MGQVAFDTHEFIETLENAGLPVEQAKAISLAVRKSHEAVDVATRRDLDDMHKDISVRFEKTDAQIAEVRKDLSAEIGNVRKDMATQFEKTDAQIAEVRKDLSAEIGNVRKDMAAQSEKTNAQIADVRKDLSAEIGNVRKDMAAQSEKTNSQITDVRKDIDAKFDKLGLQLTIKLGVMIAAAVGIVAAVLRMPL